MQEQRMEEDFNLNDDDCHCRPISDQISRSTEKLLLMFARRRLCSAFSEPRLSVFFAVRWL